MNGLSNNGEDVAECPLCMEPLEVDDLNFYPCTCGYQICRFCWHRIRTDENELCPACRKAYPENPADFTPLSQEQISALKAEKRQRDQQRKQKISENRKHLANVRVVQKNLVFVVGLPPRLADAEILRKHEYFGKYGKIHKVVINPSTTYAGVQGPSASAYVTYCVNNDALRAIQSVNNIMIDGRLIKTSLGTTKYCSHFMKNQSCPKPDCMYLHELGDPEASFTKEEMHQGKHQEYEKRLHDSLIAQTAAANISPTGNGKLTENNKIISENGSDGEAGKDAWPCLSTSPVNIKENIKPAKSATNKENGKKKKESKSKKTTVANGNHTTKETITNGSGSSTKDQGFNTNNKDANNKEHLESAKSAMTAEEELNLIQEIEKEADALMAAEEVKADTPSLSLSSSGDSGTVSESVSGKSSPASFPDHPIQNGLIEHPNVVVEQQNKTNLEKTTQSLINDTFNPIINGTEINTNCHPMTNGVSNVIDTAARFSKLGLFDDNNSFFSTNTFQPTFFKLDQQQQALRNSDSNQTKSPQLPDLLNGTESDKDRQDLSDKLNLLKGLGDFNSQINGLQNGFGHNSGLPDLQKRNNFINSLGMPHFNGLQGTGGDYSPDFFNHSNDRFSQHQLQQQQQQLQNQRTHPSHNNMHSSDSIDHVYANNMSKFFDFHKNQQQQHQPPQQQYFSDHLNLANILDPNRISSQYLDQQTSSNGLLGSQLNKHRLQNKFEQLALGSSQQQQQQQQQHNLLQSNNNQQNSRLQSHFQPSSSVDDDLGFDPFFETQKGLAELLENEMIQQQSQPNHGKLIDNVQRSRMPPPGFNHMNAFGFGVPRAAQSSKILPFMNMGNGSGNSGIGMTGSQQGGWSHQQQQQPQQQPQHQQHPNMNFPLHDQTSMPNHLGQPNHQNNKPGYGGSMPDWTALDPAIVSFRQFPTFMSGPPPTPQSQSDMFMPPPHLNPQQQQQQQMNGQSLFDNNKLKSNDYSNRSNVMQSGYGGPHGMNLQSSIINQQQQSNSPAQVNFSHSNWLNTDQTPNNLFMNHNLTNGFSNNFEKFSIPLPPGFQNNNGSKQHKAECIN